MINASEAIRQHAGELHVEAVPVTAIAAAMGTPVYIYSAAAITNAYHRFNDAFSTHDHRVCYAVKANSNLGVLSLLARLGAGFDIVSGGELERVLRAGGRADSVVFSGVGKLRSEIETAINAGIACFNVESESELLLIADIAGALNKVAPVSLRVNPDVDARTHPYIATGLKENKFGISIKDAIVLYRRAAALPQLNVVGVDCHIGSQITSLAPFTDSVTRVLALVDELEKVGITLRHIDLGGGIGVTYKDEPTLAIEEYASAILQSLGSRRHALWFEPGRYIVANAGILVARVQTIKQNEGRRFAVVDAAMNDLIRPALYGAWQEVTAVKDSPVPHREYDIVGPVCETGDFLAKGRTLGILEQDLIAIHGAGAYGFAMSSNYNSRNRAAEVMVSGDQFQCVRERESIEDQLKLEHVFSL